MGHITAEATGENNNNDVVTPKQGGVAVTTEATVELKLLIDKETNNVIFAEAGKDFVDILFSFLTLPLGTIARLIESDCWYWANSTWLSEHILCKCQSSRRRVFHNQHDQTNDNSIKRGDSKLS